MGRAPPAAPGARRKKRLKVAAAFGRAEFSCEACAKEESLGGDPKGERSGRPRSCSGPREYRFHGGAATWTGCPRLALGHREAEWIGAYDRSGGRLSVVELGQVPMLLADAFDALDELGAQKAQHERALAQQGSGGRPGVLR